MIRFSKIDDKLTVYRNNRVVLFGAGRNGRITKLVLEQYGIPAAFYCDNDPQKWGTKVEGLPVLSPEQLKTEYDARTVVQISCAPQFELAVKDQLLKMGIECCITYTEHAVRIKLLQFYQTVLQGKFEKEYVKTLLKNFFGFPGLKKQDYFLYYYVVDQLKADSYNILCLPPKTGDNTLQCSLKESLIMPAVNCWHTYRHIPVELKRLLGGKKLKIVTAVRDVIAQNLSLFFEAYGSFGLELEFWESGGDVQALYSKWLEHDWNGKDVGMDVRTGLPCFFWYDVSRWEAQEIDTYLMQDFFAKNFEPYTHIDVFKYPFNKEKGYTIINAEDQNTEIFIYQLERLNDVADELGRFLGIENFHLVNDNVGEEKWYADAYRQAKKEIKFPRAYFDACFNSRVMTHFYSDADIEKFKQRWLPHVEG